MEESLVTVADDNWRRVAQPQAAGHAALLLQLHAQLAAHYDARVQAQYGAWAGLSALESQPKNDTNDTGHTLHFHCLILERRETRVRTQPATTHRRLRRGPARAQPAHAWAGAPAKPRVA